MMMIIEVNGVEHRELSSRFDWDVESMRLAGRSAGHDQ